MNKPTLLVLLIVFLPTVQAATISGEVYDLDFTLVKNSIITINSNPEQKIISEDGTYNFDIQKGNYVINARYYSNGILVSDTSEEVSIQDEGDYTIDLILFPSDEEDKFLLDLDDDINEEDSNFDYTWIIIVVLLIAVIILLKWKPKSKEPLKLDLNETDNVLDFIKKEGGRTTQKDIRKAFSLSEAKASLIITELEHKGKVSRIKKGRGNVIILK